MQFNPIVSSLITAVNAVVKERISETLGAAEALSEFKRDVNGYYIGYHWQSSQEMCDFESPEKKLTIVRLTLETLEDRPLFISPNANDWCADDICSQRGFPQGTVYRIAFKPAIVCVSLDTHLYHELTQFKVDTSIHPGERHYLSPKAKAMAQAGVDLFVIGSPKGDISEAFLPCPRRSIISINPIDVSELERQKVFENMKLVGFNMDPVKTAAMAYEEKIFEGIHY